METAFLVSVILVVLCVAICYAAAYYDARDDVRRLSSILAAAKEEYAHRMMKAGR